MRLYKSYIRPVLEYGAPVILGASETYIKKLQIIQNKAIRIAYKLDPLSHTEDIHKIAKIDLIKDRFQILTYKFIDSLKEHSDLFKLQNELRASRIKRGHKTHLDKLISEYAEIYDENWDCSVGSTREWQKQRSAFTVCLPRCQCRSSANNAEPALARR